MPTFICEKCGCVDNSACGGTYWAVKTAKDVPKHDKPFKDDFYNEHPVCIECAPSEYADGSKYPGAGKWHNSFKKKHWSEYGDMEKIIKNSKYGASDMVNALSYFEQVKNGILYDKVLSKRE